MNPLSVYWSCCTLNSRMVLRAHATFELDRLVVENMRDIRVHLCICVCVCVCHVKCTAISHMCFEWYLHFYWFVHVCFVLAILCSSFFFIHFGFFHFNFYFICSARVGTHCKIVIRFVFYLFSKVHLAMDMEWLSFNMQAETASWHRCFVW